jgi:hypothetical protein
MWNPRTNHVNRTSSVSWASHPLVEATISLGFPGPTNATEAKSPEGLFNTPPPYNPPSLLHPTPHGEVGRTSRSTSPSDVSGGGGEVGQLEQEEFDVLLPPSRSISPSDVASGGGDDHEDVQIETGGGDFTATSSNDRTNDSDSSTPAQWPTQPLEAPRHLDISATVEERNIIAPGVRRDRRPPTRFTNASIVLHNPHIPLYVARSFAAALTAAPAATRLQLVPEPATLKQARRHVYAKDWQLAEVDKY